MEQHPIPQQISSYEFKLVGDMTLKQFLKAGVGVVVALLINSTGLIFFIKWPLALLFGAGGLLIAFVPFQDRPLETWVMSFIRSIYSPTIYTYKKTPNKDWMDLINNKPKIAANSNEEVDDEDISPIKDISRVNEFINSLPSVKINYKEEEVEVKTTPVKTTIAPQDKVVVNTKTDVVEKEVDWRDQTANLNLKSEKLEATGKAVFGQIPMPDIPEIPNILVGMVTNQEGKIVEAAIIEVQDEKGNPSRVLKTNQLGQFKTTTQLADGKYLVITEKDGYNFDRVNIQLNSKIVEPIKIQAYI